MFEISPELLRSIYLWKIFKNIISEKWITTIVIAERMKTWTWAVINVLNWKKQASDTFFQRIWEAIWLTNKEIKQLFKKADLEAFKYKYNEEINILEDIDFDLMLSREYWITDADAIKDIKKYIEFIKNKK